MNVNIELDASGGEDVGIDLLGGDTQVERWPDGLLSGHNAQRSSLMHISVPENWMCSDTFGCQYFEGTPSVRYVGTPEQCTRIRFMCEPGESYFSNPCGCGYRRQAASTLA